MAICGCTLSMSIRKLSAPRLSAKRSKVPAVRPARVDLGGDQRVDVVAHAHHGLRGLVQAQHRQHAAHRRQLRRHRDQHLALRRIAEELVDVLFDLGQRRAQFLHHAAHGLAVGDPAVQLFHPRLRARLANGPGARRRCAAPGAARGPPARDGRGPGLRATRRGTAARWRLPSPARARRRRRRARCAPPIAAAPWPASRPRDTASAASRRPARTARPGPAGAAVSPPATADHMSLAAATRLRACASSDGSKRPRRALS